MRIGITIGSEAVGKPVTPTEISDHAVAAEADGFTSAWCVHFSRGVDSLTTLAAAASRTSTLELGVGVIPTHPRHPIALAQSAATVQEISHGRLTLGVGVSHRPVVEGMHGLGYDDQIGHMREYLTILTDLLVDGASSFSGRHYQVEAAITVPGTTPVPVVVGALAPRMSRLAGELASGVITWLAGPRSLEEVILPAVLDGSAGQNRRVIAAIPVAVDSNVDQARAVAGEVFGRYGTLPNYARLFEREGVTSPSELVVVGDESGVESGLAALVAAGATELWAVPFDTGHGTHRTVEFLRGLSFS